MSTAFSQLAEVYDAMIDWPARLAHEAPFYRWLLTRATGCGAPEAELGPVSEASNYSPQKAVSPGPQDVAESSLEKLRLLDAACGTGRHAEMFHRWGLEVEAADVSAEMIDYARQRVGQSPRLHWVVRGFEQPVGGDRPFDVAICVGNSLALAPDKPTAQRAIEQLLAAVRPGGLLLIHLLNLRRLPDGTTVWQKCQRSRTARGEVLIVKGVRRCCSGGAVELLVFGLPQAELWHAESALLLGLSAEWLQSAARQAGANTVELYGGYDRQPYDAHQSVDLLLVAVK